MLPFGPGCGHCCNWLDPAIHRWWVCLHRHSDRPPRTACWSLQFWPVSYGNSGPAVWSCHDGSDCRVWVRWSGAKRSSWQSENRGGKVKKNLGKNGGFKWSSSWLLFVRGLFILFFFLFLVLFWDMIHWGKFFPHIDLYYCFVIGFWKTVAGATESWQKTMWWLSFQGLLRTRRWNHSVSLSENPHIPFFLQLQYYCSFN